MCSSVLPMDNSLYEVRVQGIAVLVFITLDWIFVLMSKSTMVPCRCVSERKLSVSALINLNHFHPHCWPLSYSYKQFETNAIFCCKSYKITRLIYFFNVIFV